MLPQAYDRKAKNVQTEARLWNHIVGCSPNPKTIQCKCTQTT